MALLHVNGAMLHIDVRPGPPESAVLVCLHGFTGSTATWEPFYESWQKEFTVVAFDALGHGQSSVPDDPKRYGTRRAVADMMAVLDALNIGRGVLLGYSMGGRMALHLALSRPDRFSGLILESGSPGLRTEAERAARVAADEQWVAILQNEGIEAFVNYWEELPIFASQKEIPHGAWQRQRALRLQNDREGLARSLRGFGTGAQDALHDRLPELAMPTLLIVGERDPKYVAIGEEMHEAIADSRLVIVPDAGHAVHLEQPRVFGGLVREHVSAVTEKMM